jgi:hypothetical protein
VAPRAAYLADRRRRLSRACRRGGGPGLPSRSGRNGSPERNSPTSPETTPRSCKTVSTNISARSSRCAPSTTPHTRSVRMNLRSSSAEYWRVMTPSCASPGARASPETSVPSSSAKSDEGIEGYQIKAWETSGTPASAPQENEYFPVLYSTGIPTALSVLGVDLSTEPNRREALEHARDGDRMSAASEVELRHNGGGDWRGFFVALPVYRRDLPHATIEDRRRNLLGILGGTFQTTAVIDSILAAAKLPPNIDLYLYAAVADPDARSAYTRISPEHSERVEVKSQAQLAEMGMTRASHRKYCRSTCRASSSRAPSSSTARLRPA